MIDADGLTKKFGDLTAVDRLTLHVNEGEIFGLLGPNGAGKTTTVRMLCCLISKTGGSARIAGYDVGSEADSLKIRQLIGFVPDNVGLYDALTAYDNLDFYGRLYDVPDDRRNDKIRQLLEMLDLWEKKNVLVGTFSKGMRQKLALARAMIHEPQVLFFDEPTANLDPEAAKTVRDFILDLKKQKRTIFLNTHNLDEARKVCDKIGILNTSLRALGSPEELERNVGGRATVIVLEKLTNDVRVALKGLHVDMDIVENEVTIRLESPEKENPSILDAVFRAGGRVQSATIVGSTLEDAYLKLVRKEAVP
ncbi:MAG TPA: ABC transporter ATP-binding protein [Methanomassiliicoccales archaeon]|nr:ABC transporter ATP-binding protein [Methanomassiliicoccales archaeon]